MKVILLCAGFMIVFSGRHILAQSPDIVWTQTFGGPDDDSGFSVQQTSDGGYIVAGITGSYTTSWDAYLIRTDSNGDSIWTKTFGGSDNVKAYSVQQTTDGGYILAGYISSGLGLFDAILIKTDSNGDAIWTNIYGGSSPDYAVSVQQTTDGGYIATGFTYSNGAGGYDVFLIRTDSNGNAIWTKTYGGTSDDYGNSVQQTTDEGFVITGSTRSFGLPDSYVYLIRTDSNGDTLWTCTYPENRGYCVQQTTDGGFIVTGPYGLLPGFLDVHLIKTDSSGDTLWTRTFGDTGDQYGCYVQQTTDGGYILVGDAHINGRGMDIFLMKTSSEGDSLWAQTFGGTANDYGKSIQQTTDGGFIIAGYTYSYGTGSNDVYLIKLEYETGIEEEVERILPTVALESITPNPFSSYLSITYSIPEQARVELAVFDLSGRLVEELISDQLPAGTHTMMWSPSESIPNGCYLIEFNACGYHTVRRCLKLN